VRRRLREYRDIRRAIDIPDELYRELKIVAAKRGMTPERVVWEAVERGVHRARRTSRRLQFPLLHSAEPGSLNLTNAEIDEFVG